MNRVRSNPWIVLLVLCLGFFMILLDATIVNIAIPSIIDSLQASLDAILWVLNAYILAYAVLLITAGRLGDVFGQRTLFLAGLALFTLASAFCGLAQDIDQLIIARVIQGIGGALLTPQTLAILTTIFPPAKRGAAFGVWGAVAGLAGIAGPTLGGLIVANWSWRWIFYVNLPIGVLALAATVLVVPDLRTGRRHRLDVVGVALASSGLLAIVFGVIEGQRYNWGLIWGPLTIPTLIGGGVLVLVAFFVWERTRDEPLIPLSLFGNHNYALMNGVLAAVSFGMLGLFLPLTLYFQSVLGMTALQAGLTLAPSSLASLLVAPVAGRLADKIGGKYILMVGLLLYAIGMGLVVSLASPQSSGLTFLGPLLLAGVGIGGVFAPSSTIAMRAIDPRHAGAASGVFNTTRQLGGVLGSAVVGAMLQSRLALSLHDQALRHAAQIPPALRAVHRRYRQRRQGRSRRGARGGNGAASRGHPTAGHAATAAGRPRRLRQRLHRRHASDAGGAHRRAGCERPGLPRRHAGTDGGGACQRRSGEREDKRAGLAERAGEAALRGLASTARPGEGQGADTRRRHSSDQEEGKTMNDMNEQSRRKELRARYKHAQPEAGVYHIRNSQNNKALLGSTRFRWGLLR